MVRFACLLAPVVLLGSQAFAWPQDKAPAAKKLSDGVYAVKRDSVDKKDVLPLGAGESLVVDRHRYVKKGDSEPPRFVVVGQAPDVALDLDGKPKAIREGKEIVGITLTLRPKAAKALERLTGDRRVRQVAIVIGGEVVTMHKVREAIKGGKVQITSCAPKAAAYLLEQLEKRKKDG
jgi:preprotein translocase subunit SecD